MKRMVLLLAALLLLSGLAAAETPFEYMITERGAVITHAADAERIRVPDLLEGVPVVELDAAAFVDCTTARVIILPDSVTDIGSNIFSACVNLQEVRVSPDHPTLGTFQRMLFHKEDRRLICCPRGRDATRVEVPPVRIIGEGAFCHTRVEEVHLPRTVTEIGNAAFSLCGSLTSITLPEGLMHIGDYAFGASGLCTVSIPASVTTMGVNPFFGCSALEEISVAEGNPAFYAFFGVLYTADGKLLISCPDGRTELEVLEGTEFICDAAIDSPSITWVCLPASVTEIGEGVFDQMDDTTFTVERGSYAAEYCRQRGLRYEYWDTYDWLFAP